MSTTAQIVHINSHGQYPFDEKRAASPWSWARVRELTPEAAASMLGCLPVEKWSDTEPNRKVGRVGGPAMRQRGLVVLRLRDQGVPGVPPLVHAENVNSRVECLPYEFRHGDEAVYYDSGQYWLVRASYVVEGRYSYTPRPSQVQVTVVRHRMRRVA